MALRKFAADYLFTGYEMLDADAVLVTDELGKVQNITHRSDVHDGIERYNGIITPGFINCHCHLELSHMKGLVPKKTGMTNFLLTVMNNRNRNWEEIAEAMIGQDNYMLNKGIVAVGDICNTTDTIAVKSDSKIYYHNFIEATGFIGRTAPDRFNAAKKIYLTFLEKLDSVSIVPHAPYSVSPELFRLIDRHQPYSLLSIHNQESLDEENFILTGSGNLKELYRALNIDISEFRVSTTSSIRYSMEMLSPTHSLILVHNVHTSRDDLQWINQDADRLPDPWWCLCPNANLYINETLPDMSVMLAQSHKLIIGTDSLASNTQLSILEELKTLQQRFPKLSTKQLLTWATLNGAKALRIDGRYGSFEKGKQPGVVIVEGGHGTTLEGAVSRRIL